MLDGAVSGWLGLVAEVALLKEHGVEQCVGHSTWLPLAAWLFGTQSFKACCCLGDGW